MLLIQNETTEFVKEKLSSFCKKTSEGLSKPKQKFMKDMYKESPKIANRITENCKSGESGFFELSFLFI